MFDIGWPELLLIMVIALVVIGPKDLPAAIRAVTTVMRKVRAMAADFQSGLDEIAREAGVDEIKRGIDDVVTYDPKAALENIGEIDEGEFSFDDSGAPAPGNSILDPDRRSQTSSEDVGEGGEAAAEDGDQPAEEAVDEEVSRAANEDQPAGHPSAPAATPATGRS